MTLARATAGFGFFTYAPLRPVIVISYWRYRFVEPETGLRISIDSHIRSSMVMPGVGRGERGLELPGAVVEVKGTRFDVPRSLRAIAEIGSSWTRYSKYSSSLDCARDGCGVGVEAMAERHDVPRTRSPEPGGQRHGNKGAGGASGRAEVR